MKEGILIDPAKVVVVLQFLESVSTKQLKGFLGLIGYYQ